MRVRYKHLVAGGADVASWSETSNRHHVEQEALGWDEYEPPPRVVESQDGEGTLDEVRLLVRHGKLGGTDLVDLGRGWENVADAPELEEALARAPHRVSVPWKLPAIVALWAASTVGLAAGGLDLYWVALVSLFLVPAIASVAWDIRRDLLQHSAHPDAVATVTSEPLPSPGEAEPGSVSIAQPLPAAGALSPEPVQSPVTEPVPNGDASAPHVRNSSS